MAAIDVYLQEILDAVYGEEVRGAIHDAIQQVYTDGHTGVPTTRTINGHSLSNDITLTASDVGAVAKTGDTMTGGLSAPAVTISTAQYPRLYFRDGSNALGQMLVNHSSHNMSFREMKDSGTNFDSFGFPAPTLSETSDNYYDILTSKTAVTVAQGGTGATTAANALTNLGAIPTTRTVNGKALSSNITLSASDVSAVAKSGDTMTGNLQAPRLYVYASDYPSIRFLPESGSSTTLCNIFAIANTRQLRFSETPTDQTGSSPKLETYVLPEPSTGLTSNATYTILTSKSAVTIAQGGTGATTAANARTNLGITPANIGAVPTTRTINSKALSSNITLSASDVSALPSTGGTLTGNLLMNTGNAYPTIGLLRTDGSRGIWIQPNVTGDARLSIYEYNTAATYYERYDFPTITSGLSSNASYNIITSKGGTIAGALSIDSGSNYVGIGLKGASGAPIINISNTGTRLTIDEKADGSTKSERYLLPTPDSRSSDVWYGILTTKSAVTIAQGGTGVTSQGASHAALAVAGGYCDYTNATSFTFTLPNLSDAHYHHGIVFGGDTSTLYCYLMFINVQKTVSFYPLYAASSARTLTGTVSGNTLTIVSNATSYGGIRLIWFNDTATGA